MNPLHTIRLGISLAGVLLTLTFTTQAAPLKPGDPILLPNTHGGFDFIRIDTAANRLLLGHEGNKSLDVVDLGTRKLVLLNRATGKILVRVDTGARVDEMAYDPGRHTAYCASRAGKISAVAVASDQLTALGDVPDETGTGSIAVDPKTHTVWIAYHKGQACLVQPFTPAR